MARGLNRQEHALNAFRSEVAARFDRTPSMELYTVQHQRMLEKIAELEADLAAERQARAVEVAAVRKAHEDYVKAEAETRKEDVKERLNNKRLMFTALIAPIALILLQLYFAAQGWVR
ncbi:hypothetical protein CLV72_11270 [Allonocardiopsis opalescens]|uniref:Uncharacterized protein n=2 Tax=Allonocardiopsis opalescens TaxID=1144618 RepID=A0A2T0PSX6_9ACTN|nr:hypothetical protein CLV72_11270 [Allonocardiopsis opalescens]